MRPLHPIIRRSLSFRHAILADTCVIATLLSTTTYSLYGLQCKHAFANVCRHLVCVDSASLASLLSTTTYSLYGLHDHAFGHVCRYLVCVASASLTSHCVAFLGRSSPSRLSAGAVIVGGSRLCIARTSLSRRFGASGQPLFHRLHAQCTWLHTFACVIQRRTDTTLACHHVHWRSHIPV